MLRHCLIDDGHRSVVTSSPYPSGATVNSAAIRGARTIVLAGEAIVCRLALKPGLAPDAISWDSVTRNPEFRQSLVSAGTKVIAEIFGGDYGVRIVLDDESTVVYRVSGYARLETRNVFAPPAGRILEDRVLETLRRLAASVTDASTRAAGAPVAVDADWAPGQGLQLPFSGAGGGSPGELAARIVAARSLQRRMQFMSFASLIFSLLALAILGILWRGGTGGGLLLPLALYTLLPLVLAGFARVQYANLDHDIEDLQDQIDLGELIREPLERRAQKLFQVHSHQLKRYYDQALRQRGAIFVMGLLCIAAGFAVIGVAFSLIESASGTTEQVVVAALGAVGGILGNFIGVVYLRMFTETLSSIGSFHDRLVFTHHLHFANFLAAKVSNEDLRNQTLAALAESMATSGPARDGNAAKTTAQDDKTPSARNTSA